MSILGNRYEREEIKLFSDSFFYFIYRNLQLYNVFHLAISFANKIHQQIFFHNSSMQTFQNIEKLFSFIIQNLSYYRKYTEYIFLLDRKYTEYILLLDRKYTEYMLLLDRKYTEYIVLAE